MTIIIMRWGGGQGFKRRLPAGLTLISFYLFYLLPLPYCAYLTSTSASTAIAISISILYLPFTALHFTSLHFTC